MKTILMACVLMFSAAASFAQDMPKPPAPEDRWKHDSKAIAEKTSFDQTTVAKMKPAFMAFYKNMDAMMKDRKERPRKEEVEPMIEKRNAELKKTLTAAQFQSFSKIQREIGPKPPGEQGPPRKN